MAKRKNVENYFVSLSGVKIPQIIYGTAWKEERTAALVEMALTKGFRGIDTACQPKHYQEDLVGEGIAKVRASGIKREELYIQTKFTSIRGQDPKRIPYHPNHSLPDQMRESISVSLKNLRTDYLDSLVLHSPFETWEQNLLAWRTLEEVVESGKVKQIGISNCYDISLFTKLFDSALIKPAVLQNRFYADSNYDFELRDFCQKKGVFYQCFWTLNANKHIWQSREVQSLSQKYGKTPEQIYFRCLNQLHVYPLFGTTSPLHMQQDLELFSFSLTSEECDLIRMKGPF